jgi:pimeloyl-ACP methyl ester carboxylesterase
VELWWEAVGSGRPVLLVPGRGDNADLYPSRFVDPLVAVGCRVLRYDPRDTGLSPAGTDDDTLDVFAADALSVLDAAGEASAHLVGFSMGGLILTDVVVQAPDRVRSLSFLSAASPDPEAGIGPDFFDMVGDEPVSTFLAAMHEPSAADRAWIEGELARSEQRAPVRPEAGMRHQEASFRSEWLPLSVLADVQATTLVVHGDADRKLPLAHAEAFASIDGARLEVVPGMGHLPRPAQWDAIASLVVEHIVRCEP